MKIKINPRENGACPMCIQNGSCPLHVNIKDSIDDQNINEEMEIVIYSCPFFKEK